MAQKRTAHLCKRKVFHQCIGGLFVRDFCSSGGRVVHMLWFMLLKVGYTILSIRSVGERIVL